MKRIYNLDTRSIVPESQEDGSENILTWSSKGNNNDFPQYLIKLIDSSPTISALLTTKKLFIQGDGVNDEDLARLKLNPRQDLDELIQDIAHDFSYFNGYALKVIWKVKDLEGNLTPASVEVLPFESCRLGFDPETKRVNSVKYNPYYGQPQDFEEQNTVKYELWSDDINVLKQDISKENYNGHVLYYSQSKPGHRFYPFPDHASAIDWIGAEGEIGSFHYDNISSGFFIRTLLTLIGDPKAPATFRTDSEGNEIPDKTNAEIAEEMLRELFSGSKGAKVATFWALNPEDLPKIQAFNQQTHDDLYTNIQNLLTEILARATGIPVMLANINSVGSFNISGDLIKESIALMHSKVAAYQRQIEKDLKRILKFKDISEDWIIKNYYPAEKDEKFELSWNELTPNEKRNWIKENTSFDLDENDDTIN